MLCGSTGRTPPSRAVCARRIVVLVCVLALWLGPSAGPAAAYPCGPPSDATRTLAGHVSERDCEPAPPRQLKRRTADPMSFVFFIGIMLAVVLVPVALGRQDELSRE
jgi:hypothetical protein